MPPIGRRSWRRFESNSAVATSRWWVTRGIAATSATADTGHFGIDEAKVAADARFDGKWVLRTNTDLDTSEVALQYKRLWMVEHWFRSVQVAVADPSDLP